MDCHEAPLTNRQASIANGIGFLEGLKRHTPQLRSASIVRFDPGHDEVDLKPTVSVTTFEHLQSQIVELQHQRAELERQSEELQRTRVELERARSRCIEIYERAPVGFCTISAQGIILDTNSTLSAILDISTSELMGQPLLNFVCNSFRTLYEQRKCQLLQTKRRETYEIQMLNRGRVPIWVQVSAAVGCNEAQEEVIRVVITDISSLKRSEAALAVSDRLLKLIASNMPGPVSRIDRNLRYLFLNPFYERITGRPIAELVGLTVPEVVGEKIFKSIQPYINEVLSGRLVAFPSQVQMPNCEPRFALTTFIPEFNELNQVVGFFVIGLDITSSKLTEQTLTRTTELLELTGHLASVGGWELDLRNQQLIWTRETFVIHEIDSDITPTLEQAFSYFDPEYQQTIRDTVDDAINHGTNWDVELPLITEKGNRIWVRTQGVVVYENGQPTKLQGALQDITDRKHAETASTCLESQLRESQKMEAIGTLAGGVAHDFNNILAAIMGNAELAVHSIESPEITLCCLKEISKASERARDLVQQILSFSRPHATERQLISLVEVVEESIRLLRATLPARVALTLECCNKVPKIKADTTQIEQVILNLATNAYQALQGTPGCISIQVETVPLNAELMESLPSLKPLAGRVEQMVRLTVADDGPGMDTMVVARLFEPFFTTKPVGEGTGLGLAVVHGIIRTHEGAITVESHPGEGATFTIYLPVPNSEEDAVENAAVEHEQVAASGNLNVSETRILYVDDDPAVMQSVAKLLQLRGFAVESFSDQMEAVEAVRSRADQFDLVISDYNMPSLSGIDFARFVREVRTDLPVMIISGLIDDELRLEAQEAGVSELISKPFSLNAFCAAVKRIALPA